MRFKTSLNNILVGFTVAALAGDAGALTLTLDYRYDTSGFFSASSVGGQARRAVLESSASLLESLFSDTLSAITPAGENQFYAQVTRPDNSVGAELANLVVPADEVFVFVGARDIGSGVLAVTSGGSYRAAGTKDFLETVRARGQSGALLDPATDFGPWGGSIAFATGVNWYVNPNPSSTEGFSGHDLFSVALHEMTHLLGFGLADSWETYVQGTTFMGPATLSLSEGGISLASDRAHWKEGTTSAVLGTSNLQEAAMDPTLAAGTRKLLTELDVAALSDIGWTRRLPQAVSLPAAAPLLLGALTALIPLARRPRNSWAADQKRSALS